MASRVKFAADEMKGNNMEEILCALALFFGGFILLVGIAGSALKFFPPNDGSFAIAGAIVFAAGLISSAVIKKRN
jgi:hypothetical protein